MNIALKMPVAHRGRTLQTNRAPMLSAMLYISFMIIVVPVHQYCLSRADVQRYTSAAMHGFIDISTVQTFLNTYSIAASVALP